MTVHRLKALGIMLIAFFALLPLQAQSAETGKSKVKARSSQTSKAVRKDAKIKTNKGDNAGESNQPDFAYPETVINTAEAGMRKAAASGDTQAQIDYAIQLVQANNLISHDRMPGMLHMLDSLAQQASPTASSILYSVEAQLYSEMFKNNRRVYSERTLPAGTYPSDPTEWSEALYADKVCSLVEKSMSNKDALQGSPSSAWSKLLTDSDAQTLKLYPTLYSILASRNAMILREFGNGSTPIPFGTEEQKPRAAQRCMQLREQIITDWNAAAIAKGDVAEITVTLPLSLAKASVQHRYESYIDAFEKYADSPYRCEFLYKAADLIRDEFGNDKERQERMLLERLRRCIADYPDYYRINEAKNIEKRLLNAHGTVSGIQSEYSTRNDVEVKASTVNYANAPYISLYKLPKNYQYSKISAVISGGECKFIKSLPTKSGELQADTCTLNFGKLEVGKYVLVPAARGDGKPASLLKGNCSFNTFTVSDLALNFIADRSRKNGMVAVVNPYNGQPLPGVQTTISTTRGHKNKTETSNEQGLVNIGKEWAENTLKVTAKQKNDECVMQEWFTTYDYKNESKEAVILTDLALYKPGDKCNFSVIAYMINIAKRERKPLPSEKVDVVLYNASYVACDTITLETDQTGRATGSFAIPKEGMLGGYTLTATGDNKNMGSCGIQVAEYKQPTFYVELDKPENTVSGEPVKISGKVFTYSGMPVSDADVTIYIEQRNFWWRATSHGDYGTTAKTGADGKFAISLSTERLKGTSFDNSIYAVKATATSQAGESQESEYESFSVGKVSHISYNGNTKLNADGNSVKLSYEVTGIDLDKQPITYSLTDRSGQVKAAGESRTASIEVQSTNIPSGEYTLTAKCGEDTDKATIIIYRDTDKTVPVESALWVVGNTITADKGAKKAIVKAGSSYPDSYILYTVSNESGVLTTGYVHADATIEGIEVPVPQVRNERIWVDLATYRNSRPYSDHVTILPAAITEDLKPERVAFRDKINAGGKETWTFRYKLGDKPAGELPVIATLSNAALNSITPFKWRGINDFHYYSPVTFDQLYNYTSSLHFSERYKTLQVPQRGVPYINTYLNSFNGSRRYYRTNSIMVRGTAAQAEQVEEVYALDEVYATEAPMKAMTGAAAKQKESVSADMEAEEMAEGAGDAGATETESQKQYRPAEMALAWFKPNLSTDNEGNLSITFDVPDYNTTWQLQMFGYTPDLINNVSVMETTASKPVMISSHAPRFLRTGDKTVLTATIYNNTDKATRAGGSMELFNPLTGAVLASQQYNARIIEAMGSTVIAIEYEVPSDIEFVGIRCKGTVPGFTDGEQSLIGIYPSSSPVSESYPFYLSPSANEYEMKLPKVDKNAQVSLQYCDNPIWECVTALPDMSFDKTASVLSRANSLYGNAIANGLVKSHPKLGEAIKAWSESGDPTLVSPLERNPELKIAALNNTPWINNAQGETLRMSRLTELLDTDKNEAAIEDALTELIKEQKEGGWSWCKGMKPSVFITGQVLWRLGMLESMGYLPNKAGVRNMVKKALKYCDKELYAEYLKADKQFSTSEMLNYLYIRSFFDYAEGDAGFNSLKRNALKAVEKEWKEFGIYNKATAATLLWREKRPMAARNILESLKQYSSRSAERGMWFDNLRNSYYSHGTLVTTAQALEAYAEITPDAEEIDQLRQWLIIERQAQDWGNDAQTAEVVHAILTTGTDQTNVSTPATFTLNGKPLAVNHRSLLTGSFTIPLNAEEVSGGTLRVEKSGNHQSWGGVLTRYIAPIKDVKQFSESDISISKRVLAVEQSVNGLNVSEIGKNGVEKGQRVRVQLTVSSDRDIDYVVITDERGGCMSPAEQVSEYVWSDGTGYYREVRNEQTNFYLPRLPKGTYLIEYDCFADTEGEYATGIASIQSLYAPTLSAHSGGAELNVK